MPSIMSNGMAALSILLGLCLSVHAQAIGSFYFGKGSAVVAHNPNASNFLYSINSAKGFSDMQSIEVKYKPKNGTAISCTGYSGPTSVYGQVFYQSTNSSLAFLFFKCSYASGICVNYGEHIISSNVTVPVSPNTQVAAALFSKDIGYRVTYQDIHGSIRQLAYANNTQGIVTNWADGNLTGNLTVPDGSAIATTYVSPSNVTGIREVLYAVGEGEVRSSRAVVENKTGSIHDQKVWIENPSIPLPTTPLTHLTTLTYNSWDCIFYIDHTSHLQFLRSTDGGTSWSLQPPMDISAWPLADSPNAQLTAAASFNKSDFSAYVYYRSGGRLVQARIKDALWEDAVEVRAKPNGTLFIGANNVPGLNTPSRNKSKTKVKIGAGVGGAVGFLIALLVGLLYFRQRRNAGKSSGGIEKPDSIYDIKENSSSEYGFPGMRKAELSGLPSQRMELDHDPECRLLHQLQARGLGELRGVVPLEMEGDGDMDVRREELDAGLCSCELNGNRDGARGVVCELMSPVSELGVGDERWEGDRGIDRLVMEKRGCGGSGQKDVVVIVSELAAGSSRERNSEQMKRESGEASAEEEIAFK